jgi:uncharacterized protein YbjT (DUF2867 family)
VSEPIAKRPQRVLVTGATGYVGGRLLESLEACGDFEVRCIARRPEFLRSRVSARTEVVGADCLDEFSLRPALEGIDTAFYLVHSMGSGADFEAEERTAARNFARAAAFAGVKKIIYLGGLGSDDGTELSPHLRSRHETGAILRESGAAVIELRASVILGSGSLSYELIRALVERLPVMICPRWVQTPAQPIAIEDVIAYMIAALELDTTESKVFEIGGADRVSYADLMREYARQRGLKRWLVFVPFLSPRLSSLWLGMTTPVYARIGRKLIESLKNPTVVRDDSALRTFRVRPIGLSKAIERAILNEDRAFAATRWSNAISSSGAAATWGGVRVGTRLIDSRAIHVDCSTACAFSPIRRIGGANGWYSANALWRIRGFIDLLAGGVGLRRGRRDPESLLPGDTLDFWRVESFEPDRRLRLFAEMRLPGRAWLEFETEPAPGGGTLIRQTAIFDAHGLLGLLYWYGIYPLHARVFRGMLHAIAERAESEARTLAGTIDPSLVVRRSHGDAERIATGPA